MKRQILMVDLKGQYDRLRNEIDPAINSVLQSGKFINGPDVESFAEELATWIGVRHVIPCANGTDALQLAIMALELLADSEIIVPSFTYAATVEVISLLGFKPVFVDVNPHTFTIDLHDLRRQINPKTKLIIPVHLFGQCAEMEEILLIANRYNLRIVEDTAQAIGADYFFSDKRSVKAGTIGDIGTTSFFPSKNLGCYGDGGALFTNDDELAARIKMMANHGQKQKYYHDIIGCNSRLDSIQAAILRVKLQHLNDFTEKRKAVAQFYRHKLKGVRGISTPICSRNSTHVYNQFTIKIDLSDRLNIDNVRNCLQLELKNRGIPTMIYYPVPNHLQKAYYSDQYPKGSIPMSEKLSERVLSLPIHTEMNRIELKYITDSIEEIMDKMLSMVTATKRDSRWKQTILRTNQL